MTMLLDNIGKNVLDHIPYESRRFFVNTVKMKAVYEEDVATFLQSLGMYDAILNGDIKCYNCGKPTTLENFLSVFPHENDIHVCCTSWSCYNSLLDKGVIK